MRLKKHHYVFGLMFLLLSCATTQNFQYEADNLIWQPEISNNSWFNNYFEIERIVQIETTDDYMMSDLPKRIILYNDKLIILDAKTSNIFVVDAYTGKIITHINRPGRGSGEWRHVLDITIDDQNEQILAYNDYQKLLYFSLEGEFLKEENVNDNYYSEIMYHNGNLIFYCQAKGTSRYPYLFDIYNLSDRTWKSLGTMQEVDFHGRIGSSFFVKSRNLWFAPALDMGLHVLDLDSAKIRAPYRLDVKNPLTENIRKLHKKEDYRSFNNEVNQRGILYMISSIRETENYIALNTNSGFMMLLNKNTLEIHGMRWMVDKYLGIRQSRYYPHDADDNRIMFLVNSDQWLYREPTDQIIPERLQLQSEGVIIDERIEPNPILMFYKER